MKDNEAVIDTTLNTDGVEKGAKEVQKTVENMSQSAGKTAQGLGKKIKDGLRYSIIEPELEKIKNGISKTFQKAQEELSKSESIQKMKEEYAGLEKELADLQLAFDKAKNKRDEFIASGGNESSKRYANLTDEMISLDSQITDVKDDMARLNETINQPAPTYNIAESTAMSLLRMKNLITSIPQQIKSNFEKAGNAIKQALNPINILKKSFKGFGYLIYKGLTAPLKVAQKMMSGLSGSSKSFGSSIKSSFGSGFKNILKYTLGIRSLFVLFNKLRSALVDGFKNLAQFNNGVNPVNSAISSLKSSLTTLKNSFASAFAPILTTVAPALTLFIDKISQAVTALGMLFAKLSGASTFTKAVKVQENYAASLDKTGDSAKKASKQVYAFDELQTQNKDDNTSGGGGAGGVSPNQMFETVDIPSAFDDLANKFKEAWEKADFTEIGTIVGTKIKNALDSIDWEPIKSVADKLGKSFGTFLNGFFGTQGFAQSVGKAIGEGFNTAFTFVSSFLNSTDFSKIGSFITTGLQTIFNTFDWSLLGSSLSGFVSGVYDFISGAIEGIDWQSLPSDILDAIIEFFKGFDATKVAKSIARLFGAAVGAVAGFIVGIGKMVADVVVKIKESWDSQKAEWEKMGISVLDGVKLGIANAINDIGKWIIDNLFNPFINGFKNAFGIHSPSTVMAEMGGYIMDGLKNGVKDKIGEIKSTFTTIKNSIQDIFKTIPDWFENTFAKAWQKVKDVFSSGGQVFNGIKDGILNGLKTVINALISGINQVVKIPFDGLNTALGKIRGVSILGNKPFENLIPTISVPQIPYLATGTVVPRQAGEFAAILGDNNRETEVVSPLSTMKQAMAEVLAEYGGQGGDVYISADGDMDAIIRLFKFKIEKEDKRVGRNFEKVVPV